jgi:hypothetical protein
MQMRFNRRAVLAAAAVAAVTGSIFPSISRGTDRTWDGFSSNNFSLGSNWTASIAPASTDAARFLNQAGIVRSLVNLDASRTVADVSIDGTPGVGAYQFQTTSSSLLTVTNDVLIGFGGLGATPVTFNGFRVTASNVGVQDGTLSVAGGALVTTSGQFVAQGAGAINVGTATVNAGAVNALNTAAINLNTGATVTTGNVNLVNTARLNINSGASLAFTGFTALSGGTLTLNAGGTLNVAGSALSTDGAGFIQFNRDFALPAGKTLRINQGGDIASTDYIDIGAAGNGTFIVDGAGSTASIGSGSSFYTDWGNGNTATVTISNSGAADYNRGLQIAAANANSNARVNINTGGSLNVDRFLFTGGFNNTASITINNATLSTTGTAEFRNGTTIALQSGTLSLGGSATLLAGATLNRTGGTLFNAPGTTLTVNGGTINNTGGALGNGVTLAITNGGKFDNGATFFDVANGAATGTVTVTNPGSRITATAGTSDWGRSAGNNATITFSDSGAGTFGFVRLSELGGASTLNLQSDGQLTTSSLKASDATTPGNVHINIAGGVLNNLGVASFLNGTQISLSSGSLQLGGNSTIGFGATLNQTGGTFAMGPNTTLNIDGGKASVTSMVIENGVTTRVVNAGSLTATDLISISGGANSGTLLIDGNATAVTCLGAIASTWGGGVGPAARATISNGAQVHLARLDMAPDGGSVVVNLNSDAELRADNLRTGQNPLVLADVAINIAGGVLTTTNSSLFRFGSGVNLQTFGTFQLGATNSFLVGSNLNWTGASSELVMPQGSTLAFDGGTGTFSAPDSHLSLPTDATFVVAHNGIVRTNSFLDLGNSESGGLRGTLLVTDPGSSFTSTTSSFSVWSFGQENGATVTFANSGVGSFAGGLQIGPDGGAATVNIQSAARLNTASLLAGRTLGVSDGVQINVSGGTLAVTTGSAELRNGVTVNYSAGSIGIAGPLALSGNAQVLLTAGGDKAMSVGGLSMSGTSKIDLSNNQMFVGYTGSPPLALIRDFIAAGHNGGNWSGNRITSSFAAANPGYALGYVDTTLAGSPAIDIRLTRYGDADLSGSVNLVDFNRLAANFGQSGRFWSTGDFNFDGTVNLTDFNLLAANFGLSAGADGAVDPQDWANLAAAVPEPALACSLSMLALSFVRIRSRRRRG